MKLFSIITLAALVLSTSCSMMNCCKKESCSKDKESCSKEKESCKKEKKKK